jgi:multiple sugar transport system permease protein
MERTCSSLSRGFVVSYLAGPQDIPGELYEAAEIDGASIWQRLRYVTFPQMRFLPRRRRSP